MWTLDEALTLIRELNPLLVKAGWYLGLTGSVLIKGHSEKDLDLIAYPLNTAKVDREWLYRVLVHSGGLTMKWDVASIHGFWKQAAKRAAREDEDTGPNWMTTHPIDSKHVEGWHTEDGKRIDLFILG